VGHYNGKAFFALTVDYQVNDVTYCTYELAWRGSGFEGIHTYMRLLFLCASNDLGEVPM